MGKLYDKICNKLDEWDERINTYTINKKYKYVMRVHELGDYGIDTPQFDLWGRFMAVGTYGDCRLYCKLADKGLSFEEIYDELIKQNPKLARTDKLLDTWKTVL